jgi:acetyltransferase-like isoleucine patch superfamily enzyme
MAGSTAMTTKLQKLIGRLLYYYPNKLINKLGHLYYGSQIQGEVGTIHLKGRMSIQWPNRLIVGKNCCINDGCLMQCQSGVRLGDNVTISTGAIILARQYKMVDWLLQCQKDEPDKEHEEKAVFLNDHTWIGAGAIVLPGVQINGKGVVVAAGTIVTKSVNEDYVLVAGSPMRIVKHYKQQIEVPE